MAIPDNVQASLGTLTAAVDRVIAKDQAGSVAVLDAAQTAADIAAAIDAETSRLDSVAPVV